MDRNLDPNPYAPPARDDTAAHSDGGDERIAFETASRGRRLAGVMIDGILGWAIFFGARVIMKGGIPTWSEFSSAQALEKRGLADLVPAAFTLAITGLLIAYRGQSLGKIVMRTRIVDAEGRQATLVNGLLVRTLPFTVIALLPTVLIAMGMSVASAQPLTILIGLVAVIDDIMIFGDTRRCLHDRIAGTYVAVVGTERLRREKRARRAGKKKRRTEEA
ncbi:MAG: RDD family protein [Byssovorax sp.]